MRCSRRRPTCTRMPPQCSLMPPRPRYSCARRPAATAATWRRTSRWLCSGGCAGASASRGPGRSGTNARHRRPKNKTRDEPGLSPARRRLRGALRLRRPWWSRLGSVWSARSRRPSSRSRSPSVSAPTKTRKGCWWTRESPPATPGSCASRRRRITTRDGATGFCDANSAAASSPASARCGGTARPSTASRTRRRPQTRKTNPGRSS
mmetsp:Transcript_12240/g.52606  ORF Transcript_12240/g.52606 Transcript_12240/m.52606 type:complete len:207 (+) Transcript_12240:149-769(+)